MRSPLIRKRQNRLKRQLFTATLLAVSAGGCAFPGERRSPIAKNSTQLSGEARDETLSWDALLVETSQQLESSESRPSGNDRIVVVAPIDDSFLSGATEHAHSSGSVAQVSGETQDQGLASLIQENAPNVLPPPVDSPTMFAVEAPQSVDYFVDLALAGHPSIQAARQRVSAEINRIPQARALPDPKFNNTFWPVHDQSIQTAAGRVGNQMSLSQAIPWPEKLRTKAAIVNQEVQIAQAEVNRIEREIAEAVRLAYYEVWFATRATAIIEETKGLVDDLTKVAEARYRSGGTQQDVLRAQLESDRLDDQLITLAKQKQVAQADLAALVQQPVTLLAEASDDLGLADVPAQLDELIGLAEQCNPTLAGLAWEIQRDRQKQRLARLQRYPDLQAGINWGLVSDDHKVLSAVANGHDQISFNVGTTLPIWHDKINAGIREAANQTSSTINRLDAERDALYGELRRLLAQADAFTEQHDVYEKRIIPRIEDTLKLSIADYRGKRTDFFSLIETYRELLMFETQLARIDASLAGTLARIERAVGCPALQQ